MPNWTWADWIPNEPLNARFPLSAFEYFECFDRALERMSIAINSATPRYGQYAEWLKYGDDKVKERFAAASLKPVLYRFGPPSRPDTDVPKAEEFENYFYGALKLRRQDEGKRNQRTLVEYLITEVFLQQLYRNAEKPPYEFKDWSGEESSEPLCLQLCATNYILKNLWHNYVHNRLQHINESNYHKFGGSERHRSDFEADNLSNIFLAKSYGFTVATDGRLVADEKILTMLRRNRCNKIFAARAEQRNEKLSAVEAFEEREWRYCRTLATYVSGWLLAQGRAVATLAVGLTGKVTRRGNGQYSRQKSAVVVEVNGVRVATDAENLLEEFGGRLPSAERSEHFKDVARGVNSTYAAYLKEDAGLRRYARRVLHEKLCWAGLAR